jgi:hypothetical protein
MGGGTRILTQASLRYAGAVRAAAAEQHQMPLLTSDTRIERSRAPVNCQIITITPELDTR